MPAVLSPARGEGSGCVEEVEDCEGGCWAPLCKLALGLRTFVIPVSIRGGKPFKG